MRKSIVLILVFNIAILGMTDLYADGHDPGLSYLKAKQQAEQNDMKYVLYFKADWCSPCKWMEETTFEDERFKEARENQFIFVSLDIDAFEGYALKAYFQVYALPTMIVFNPKHEIVNRREGSLNVNAFLKMLEEDKSDQLAIKNENPLINFRPSALNVSKSKTDIHDNTPILENQLESTNELFLSTIKYGVQIGAFSSYNNAKSILEKASRYTTERVEITTTPKDDLIIYKVHVGRLNSIEDAELLQKSLSSYGINGMVKFVNTNSKS